MLSPTHLVHSSLGEYFGLVSLKHHDFIKYFKIKQIYLQFRAEHILQSCSTAHSYILQCPFSPDLYTEAVLEKAGGAHRCHLMPRAAVGTEEISDF